MQRKPTQNNILLTFIVLTCLVLFLYSFNFCYFWDTIQQISTEACWYYRTGFSDMLIHPVPGLNITPTGYHPPLMAAITAGLWKIFGHELWVSHAFTFCWAMLLIYHSWKMISRFVPEKWAGWATLIILMESTVVTQMVIASPDFILLTAFVISLRAILERRPVWLAISLIFLCGINMRGIFTGVILFVSHLYYDFYTVNRKKYSLRKFFRLLLPWLPMFLLLSMYFLYYFSRNDWFFADPNGNYSSHYALPSTAAEILKHFAAFVLRLMENGRFVIWALAAGLTFAIPKKKIKLSGEEKMLLLFFLLITGLYFLFVFITSMPFSPRYFLALFFVLYLLTLRLLANHVGDKRMKIICLTILFFSITGHAWIYPEKISQSWESTLLHTPYYKLRKECYNYIDSCRWNYNDISSGFCLSGNRGFVELAHEGKTVGTSMDAKYFIYSNISNLEDEKVDELKNPDLWTPVKEFGKYPVFITVYRNMNR